MTKKERHRLERKRKISKGKSIEQFEIRWRRILHPLIHLILIFDRLFSGRKLRIMDKRIENKGNVLYICTHIGGKDIESVFESLGTNTWLFIDIPEKLYGTFTYFFLNLNGIIDIDRRNKEDRKMAQDSAINLLQKGGSLLFFPEGEWNIYSHIPVMPFYPGVARIVQKTGIDIIPIAVEVRDDTYTVNIGKRINGKHIMKKTQNQIITELRDDLATLKWQIWEQDGIFHRDELSLKSQEEFAKAVIARADYGYSLQQIEDMIYKEEYDAGAFYRN